MVLNARIGILAALALLGACARPAPPASCGAIDLVDQAALVERPPVVRGAPGEHVLLSEVMRVRAAEPFPIAGPTTPVEAEIRSRQSFHMVAEEYYFLAVRQAGTWRVSTVTIANDAAGTRVRKPDRILPPEAGRSLDTILAGSCLWRSPQLLSPWIPIRPGRLEFFPNYASTSVDVRQGDQRWTGLHLNVNLGPPGQIANLLYGDAPGPARDDAELVRRSNIR